MNKPIWGLGLDYRGGGVDSMLVVHPQGVRVYRNGGGGGGGGGENREESIETSEKVKGDGFRPKWDDSERRKRRSRRRKWGRTCSFFISLIEKQGEQEMITMVIFITSSSSLWVKETWCTVKGKSSQRWIIIIMMSRRWADVFVTDMKQGKWRHDHNIQSDCESKGTNRNRTDEMTRFIKEPPFSPFVDCSLWQWIPLEGTGIKEKAFVIHRF